MTTPLDTAVLALSPDFYWEIEDASGSTLSDSTGNGRTATIQSSRLTLGSTGIVPSDSATCGTCNSSSVAASSTYKPSIASNPNISYMAVVKYSTLPGASTTVLNNLSGNNGGDIHIASNNIVSLQLGNGSTTATATAPSALTAGHAYLIVGTYNYSTTTVTIYVYDLTAGTYMTPGTASLASGTYQPTVSYSIQGTNASYGRMAVWSNTCLTATQVTALFNAATYPGTASQALTLTGSATGAVGMVGTAAQTPTLTAQAVGAVGMVGAASQTMALSATAAATLAATGGYTATLTATAAGVASVAGSGTFQATLTGTAVGTLGGLGTFTGTLTASAAGVVGMVGSAALTAALTATAAGVVGVAGSTGSVLGLTASAVGVVNIPASGSILLALGSSASGSFTEVVVAIPGLRGIPQPIPQLFAPTYTCFGSGLAVTNRGSGPCCSCCFLATTVGVGQPMPRHQPIQTYRRGPA